MSKVVAVIIARDEEANLPKTMQILNDHKANGLIDEIVVVNDASRDKTASTARKLGAKVVTHKRVGGKRKAFVTGVLKANELGATTMLTLDADIVNFSQKSLKKMLKTVKDPRKCLMATAQQHEARRIKKELGRYGAVGNIYSNAIRAINMTALEPLMRDNTKWIVPLTLGVHDKNYRWGLEYALEQLVPKNKKVWLRDCPVYTKEALRKSKNSKDLLRLLKQQVGSRNLIDKIFKKRNEDARLRLKMRKGRKS
ncbi:MAG: glycosyltransferase [Candidatus Diapherotrites archaeon]|jgi:glycosyltransferase involved in cell wall biosynthesis|uniref:Glycosyltransferase n=1 Tax=Candidatus Iainarchaeum sp. TaxID=3101447 RepID=A0A8T5GEY3_9ARCH|nr:glycosyltransferase [Candidatus Diapherotrites archaeon]MBT7241309.1 glycosyltransferase [Candidatus Diapherotrites archaeon]